MMTRAPRIADNGVPFCSRSNCAQYDGKHCREMGYFMPDVLCGPEVAAMAADLRALRATSTRPAEPACADRAQWVSRAARCQPTTDAQPSREPSDAGGGP